MESDPVFDLERAIDLWRRRLLLRQGLAQQDIEEMESHLRDEIDDRIADGSSPQESFVLASNGFGLEGELVTRFKWANWEEILAKRLVGAPLLIAVHAKHALRKMAKHAGFTAINLVGLATGMACFIVIMLYVRDELSYDRFHGEADRTYRVVAQREVAGGGYIPDTGTPGGLADAMLRDLPEVAAATRVMSNGWGKTLLTDADNDSYYSDNLLYVEDSFFDLFSFSFIQGSPGSAFDDPASVVLTESLARKFFQDDQPLGKTLLLWGRPVHVTGVVADVPKQSHLQFDLLASIAWWRPQWHRSWDMEAPMWTYFRLHPEASLESVTAKIQALVEANQVRDTKAVYAIQPLTGFDGVHLAPLGNTQVGDSRSQMYIRVLVLVGIFLMLIAGINYVNLATARSAARAKEIGVRKVVGAARKTLVTQFLIESAFVALVAGIAAVIVAELLLPSFNGLMGKDLTLFTSGTGLVWVTIGAAVVLFGIAAGFYPALFLSSFRPTTIFSKHAATGSAGLRLRRLLVVAQFALSAFMLIGTLVVGRQMEYVQSASLGFDADQVIVIPRLGAPNRDHDYSLRNALESIPGVERAGGFLESIVGTRSGNPTGSLRRKDTSDPPVASMAQLVDDRYLEALGFSFTEGRNFSKEYPTDLTDGVILNETAVTQMGIQRPAVGKEIVTHTGTTRTIIGVVEDFHAASLHREITPFSFIYHPDALQVVLKLSSGTIAATLRQVEETLARFVPNLPFDFYFLDEQIDRQYRADREFQMLFSVMTSLILIIACMGLVGLAAATAAQRTKEIALRKVVGAAVTNLVALLSRDFARLVIIANLIAWPVAYIVIDGWLDSFAYRIDMELRFFLLAGLLAVGVALVTVCAQILRVARASPIDALAHSE